jgi:hypothetical protein
LANRLSVIPIFFLLLATTSCLSKEQGFALCNTDNSLSVFLKKNSNWEVVRESGAFYPIIGLKVFESKLWVSTYGADFFPVKTKPSNNSILIENIRFLRTAPVPIENDPADLVRHYVTDEIVFSIPLVSEHCNIGDTLQIDITNRIEGVKETLTFVRF